MSNFGPIVTGLEDATRRSEVIHKRDLSIVRGELDALQAQVAALAKTANVTTTLAGAWTQYAAPYGPSFYYKENGVVHLGGLIQSGAVGAITTLPVGFRPAFEPIFEVACYQGVAEVRVNTAGVVSLAATYIAGAGPGTWLSLSGISFPAA